MRHSNLKHSISKHGFSLIECSTVLALIALLATITMSSLGFIQRFFVRAEVEKLHAMCRYVQKCAIIDHIKYVLTLNKMDHSYTSLMGTEQFPRGVQFGLLPGLKGPPSSAAVTLHTPITFTDEHIEFYPNGTIQSGTVYIVDTLRQNAYALSNGVAHISHLRKYYYYNKTWHLI